MNASRIALIYSSLPNAAANSSSSGDFRFYVCGDAGNRTRVRAGFFRPSTCVAALSLSRPPHYVQHFTVAAQLLFGFPPVSVTETIGESPSDVRPQFEDTLG